MNFVEVQAEQGRIRLNEAQYPVQEDIKVLQQENSELVNRVLQLENEIRSLKK